MKGRGTDDTRGAAKSDGVVLRAVGDVALIGCAARSLVEGTDPAWPRTSAFLRSADVTFANFEMPIPRSPVTASAPDVSPELMGRAEALVPFLEAGVDVVSLATNHMMDWGPAGLIETISALREAGVNVVGAGSNLAEAIAPVVVERSGVKIGFCAFTPRQRWTASRDEPGTAPLELPLVRESLAQMEGADVCVVSLHWGLEMSNYPMPSDRELARNIVECGAHLILGHHPHVIQGLERVGGGWVAYSMGNFVFDIYAGRIKHGFDPWLLRAGYLVEANLSRAGIAAFDAVPTMLGESGLGAVAAGEDRERISELLREVSENIEHGSDRIWEHAGGRLVGHKLRCLIRSLKDGGVGFAFKELRNVRWRHVRLLLGFLRSRLLSRRR